MATIEVKCRFCHQTTAVYKYGTGANGHQRYRCVDCKKTFQLDYTYKACEAGIKEQIIDMAMNSSGIRETGRVFGIGYNTVMRTLKNSTQ